MTGPIHRSETLLNQIYNYLKEQILSQNLKPGEKIVESKLAVQLGTSRSPVREAIRLLLAEELLIEEDGAIRVFSPSYDNFLEIYQLRLAVESYAAQLAATRISPSELEFLKANIEKTQQAIDGDNFDLLLELNEEFHECICNASGNSRFAKILRNASTFIYYYYYLILGFNKEQTNIIKAHTDIYNALKERDAELAFMLMNRHVSKDLRIIQKGFEEKQFFVENKIYDEAKSGI